MNNEKRYLFDNPRNVRRVMWFLYSCCAVLFLLDFVIHRHTYHPWEWIWGFYPVYGFVGCVILVIVAKWMRTFLMRSEDYYDKSYDKSYDKTETKPASNESKIESESEQGGDHV